MALALLAALAVLAVSAVLGAAAWRIARLPAAPHLAPVVGFSVLLVLVQPVLYLQGRARTALALVAVLVIAAGTVPDVRASVRAGLPDGVPVVLGGLALLSLPFLVSGHFGILAMGNNDDWAMHLTALRWLAHREIPELDTVAGMSYPLGPQALAAALTPLGLSPTQALTAVMAAGPVLAARAAIAGLPPLRRLARCALALVAGLSYLGASYYVQASHKEVLAAAPILAFALALPAVARAAADGGRRSAARAALAPALLVAGVVQIMGGPGVLWPLATLGVWGALVLARRRAATGSLRAAVTPAALAPAWAGMLAGTATTVVVLAPELSRIVHFQSTSFANEPAGGLGNLGAPVPAWRAIGVWLQPDFRFGTDLPGLAIPLLAGAAVLVVVAAVHWRRRGLDPLTAALAADWLLWIGLSLVKNPYNAAKGLALMAPLMGLALVTGAALAWGHRPRPGARLALRLGAAMVVLAAAASSVLALRDGIVGADAHAEQLRTLGATAGDGRTLFLEQSDYGAWDLYRLRPYRPELLYTVHTVPLRKGWHQGMPLDLDTVSAATLNRFEWIVAPNTPFASFPPPGLRVAGRTPAWVLWHRVATVPPRETLAESWRPGAVLDCSTPAGRALSRRTGTAVVRTPPVVTAPTGWSGDASDADSHAARSVVLPRGRWDLSLQYVTRNAMTVTAPGLRTRLPANLDRMGSFFSIGTVASSGGPVRVDVRVDRLGLVGRALGSRGHTRALDSVGNRALGRIAATPRGERPRRVPLAQACGRYVDSYTLG